MKKALFFILLAISITACSKSEDTIKIGVAAPLTGSIAKMGNDFKNGILIALQEWNSRGGIGGKKIEVLFEDDANDPKQAVSVANKLVNSGIVAVIGHFTSSCSMAASEVYHKAAIVMMNASSTNPQLTQRGYRNIFRICGRDDLQGKVAADFALKEIKTKRFAILHDKTTYGQGLAEEFKKNIYGKGEIVYYGGITVGEKDFKPVLTTIKQQNPEVLYFGGLYPEGGLIVKQSKELGAGYIFLSGDALSDVKFIDIAGQKAAEGSFITFNPDMQKVPGAKNFLDSYRQRFGEPGPYSIYAYDAANILFKALSETKELKGAALADKIRSSEFKGALSTYHFDDKGDVVHMPYVIWKVSNGKFVEHWKP